MQAEIRWCGDQHLALLIGEAVNLQTVLRVVDLNRQLLDSLQSGARALAVVLMRDPYDAEYLRGGTAAVTAYGWRKCQLDAALTRLLA